MASAKFWNGFAAGAAAGSAGTLGVLLALNFAGRAGLGRVVRLEKSIQIGSPVEDVFRGWLDLERLPQLSDVIEQITRDGDYSHWRVNVEGKQFEWEAKIEQFILNQAIGWKSIEGVKHSGRITFSPLGTDTMVYVTMNYSPPIRLLTPFASSLAARVEETMEKVLRDFKAALEMRTRHRHPAESVQGTGTFGPGPELATSTQHNRFGGQPNAVDYTRPPEAKS